MAYVVQPKFRKQMSSLLSGNVLFKIYPTSGSHSAALLNVAEPDSITQTLEIRLEDSDGRFLSMLDGFDIDVSVQAAFDHPSAAPSAPTLSDSTPAISKGRTTVTLAYDTNTNGAQKLYTPGDINEVQTVTLLGEPNAVSGGTWKGTFDGQETAAIAWNASAATVKAAFELLSTIGADNVEVTGSAGGPYEFTFVGDLAALNVPLITIDDTTLTGAGTNEVQELDLSGATVGTFTLTYSGQTTGNIVFDASAATIQTALEGLSNIEVGDVIVTETTAPSVGVNGGIFDIEFDATLGEQNVAEMTIDDTLLTGTASISTTTPGEAFVPDSLVTQDTVGDAIDTVTVTVSDRAGTVLADYLGIADATWVDTIIA